MIRIAALVARARKTRLLRAARSITLALDDRGGYRLASFRCSVADSEPDGAGVQAYVHSGCLAVLRRGGDFSTKTLSDTDEDYSKAMADSIVRAIERIMQCPRTGMADKSEVDAICKNIRMGVADGAASAQKCLKFLAVGPMPNLLHAGRDRAHALRIATSGPLLREDTFKAWWDDIFGDRHALVPDIQNSVEWLAKLELCQKHLNECSGVQVSDLTGIAKSLSFAKQRFDSMAGPQFVFCVILVAIALLLAYAASDERATSEVRKRARRRLEQMPGQVIIAGLSASYADEALRFVRRFDVAEHDPSCLLYTSPSPRD